MTTYPVMVEHIDGTVSEYTPEPRWVCDNTWAFVVKPERPRRPKPRRKGRRRGGVR